MDTTVVHIKFSAEELGALDRLAADDERSRHFVVRRIVRQNLEFSGYLKAEVRGPGSSNGRTTGLGPVDAGSSPAPGASIISTVGEVGDEEKHSGMASDKRPAARKIESGASRDESGALGGISSGVVSESMHDTKRGRRAAEPSGERCRHGLYYCERCHG
jgi:hypothetical protein